MEAVLYFPVLFSTHSIRLDGTVLDQGEGGAGVSFTLTPGDHLLTVETASDRGYYSGMYHPPALGTAETVSRMVLVQCTAYALAFFAPLTLALFTLTLWRTAKDKAAFWFGLLCCCYSLYISYYFVRLFCAGAESFWYLIQSAAPYGLCFCILRLTALFSGEGNLKAPDSADGSAGRSAARRINRPLLSLYLLCRCRADTSGAENRGLGTALFMSWLYRLRHRTAVLPAHIHAV